MLYKSVKLLKFSLIELALVMSVFFVLSTLLQPSLRSMIHKSNSMGCANQLKKVGVQLFIYSEDHHRFPGSYRVVNDFGGVNYYSYMDFLAPYDGRGPLPEKVKRDWRVTTATYATNFYRCPSEDRENTQFVASYFPNAFYIKGAEPLGFTGYGEYDAWSESPSFYPVPQETLALVEVSGAPNQHYNLFNNKEIFFPYMQSDRWASGALAPNRHELGARDRWHSNGWNYLFIDGHVENLIPEETTGPSESMGHGVRGMWSWTPGD